MTTAGYRPNIDGIHRPSTPMQHRDEEYGECSFDTLWTMQQRHFWYLGRHRFLLYALDKFLNPGESQKDAIDLGGGVGGWIRYLADHRPDSFHSLALADSSLVALRMAGDVLPPGVQRFQVDLMNLAWRERWDIAFLLDVIEHLPDDLRTLREACRALKRGGLLFITTPALPQFWSYNDEVAHHLRRYTRKDFTQLAEQAGLEFLDARYFMFLLSPLYWLSRRIGTTELTEAKKRALAKHAHRIPAKPINAILTAIFSAETPLGHWVDFPWGTSVLGVFRKP